MLFIRVDMVYSKQKSVVRVTQNSIYELTDVEGFYRRGVNRSLM